MHLTASHAHIWSKCTSQPLMATAYPLENNDEIRLEGISAHEVAENLLIGREAPEGTELEMLEHIQGYVEAVKQSGTLIGIELSLPIKCIPHMTTVRIDTVTKQGSTLHIWDLKYGHTPTEVYDNSQLAIGAACYLETKDPDKTFTEVIFHIYQPRVYHQPTHNTQTLTIPYLWRLISELKTKSEEVFSDKARLLPGKHCRYCPAKGICDVALNDVTSFEYFEIPRTRTKEILERTLLYVKDMEDKLRNVKIGLEERLLPMLKEAPGKYFEYTTALGKTKWSVDIEYLKGVDERLVKETAISPAEALRLGVDKQIVQWHTHRPQTGLKIRRINTKKAKDAFLTKEK